MTQDEFRALQPGAVVRSKANGLGYIVTANFGGRVTAVRTADLTNPCEWDVVAPPVRAGGGEGAP